MRERWLLARLQLRAQAAGADPHSPHLTVDHHPGLLNIRRPGPVCPALGVADIVPELGALATYLTFARQIRCLPLLRGKETSPLRPMTFGGILVV